MFGIYRMAGRWEPDPVAFGLNEEVKRGTQPTFTSYFTCNFTRLMNAESGRASCFLTRSLPCLLRLYLLCRSRRLF